MKKLFIIGLLLNVTACSLGGSKHTENNDDVYVQLGVRYLNMNKLEIAKENLEKAVDINSDNVQAHNALAYLYEKLNDTEQAKSHYQTALKLSPDNLGVQNNLGRFLCEHKEFNEGITLLEKASTNPLNDRQWLALTNAGRCQLMMNQKSNAELHFKQALLLNGAYAPALLEMQKISFDNGNYWGAKGYLQRYLNVSEHTPQTLWIAAQTEKALGNSELAKTYRDLLQEKFPLSNEAKESQSFFP